MLQYLALGDSYTIGELVDYYDNFPNQLAKILNEGFDLPVTEPEIIAVTGWTTDELLTEIAKRDINKKYDFVTLLIGVNNQYRNRTMAQFKKEFSELLLKATSFANGNPEKVFVISIPDWGNTPFALEHNHNPLQISEEIDAYNKVKREITVKKLSNYIDITEDTREYSRDAQFLASDGLHYSKMTYKLWAEKTAPYVKLEFEDNALKRHV